MSDLKAIARLLAHEQGRAVPITRERSIPISSRPLVLIPINMAGESPSLFALGVGTVDGDLQIEVCCEPRARAEQYEMLERAAARIEQVIADWEDDPAALPQIITPSSAATKLMLAVIDRMAFTPAAQRPLLSRVGRALYVTDRAFERPDSAMLLDMPTALTKTFATGQDDHADQHLGALLQWFEPADGEIFRRVREAEALTVSTATAPDLDNNELDPRLARLRVARRDGDTGTATQLEQEIRSIFTVEVTRRYELVLRSLEIVRALPECAAAYEIHNADRTRFDKHRAYVADSQRHMTRGVQNNFAVAEFLEREFAADRVEGLCTRSESGARGAARLAGDIVIGEVLSRSQRVQGRRTIVEYDILSTQDRLAIRPGDTRVLINGREEFGFRVRGYEAQSQGTVIHAELTAGKTKPGQPTTGELVELAPQVASDFRISRAMGLTWERLKSRREPPQVTGPVPQSQDLLTAVRRHRRSGQREGS